MRKKLTGNNLSIKQKLIALIGGQLLLFIFVIYALFFWFQEVLESKVSALAEQTVKTVTDSVEVHLEQNIELSNVIVSDSSFIHLLREHPDFSETSSIWTQVQILQKLKSYTAGRPTIHAASIYNQDSKRMLSTMSGSIKDKEAYKNWIKGWNVETDPIRFHADLEGRMPAFSDQQSFITLIRKVPGKNRDDFLMIHSGKQVLVKMIGRVELWKGTGILISDASGNTVFTSGNGFDLSYRLDADSLTSVNRNDSYAKLTIKEKDYIAVNQHSNLTGWNITLMIPHKEIMQDVVRMKQFTVLLVTGMGLLLVALSVLLYTQIFNPIKKLMRGMTTLEKGLPPQPIAIKRMDELGFLQQRFNDMIRNEQQMRELIMEEKLHKKEIELKFLQSQVNPHFLYNTLDSIYWVAVENDAEELGDVVLDLSRYFRLSLSRGKEFVTILEMVEHLEYYLRIQQFRHEGKLNVIWNVDQSIEKYQLMKLMLQPVVENAIIHGMERAAESCQLLISIKERGEDLQFRVHDTGNGIERETLKTLMKEIKSVGGASEKTYGLRNLYQRLKLMYGSDMSFTLGSIQGKGTRVTIRIRKNRLEGGKINESHHC